MSAQCRHGLIRYECWKCRDEANQSTHVAHVFAGGLVTAVQQLEAKDAEIARLRQDLAAARALLPRLRQYIERYSEDHGYGYARPENPHDFSPDQEVCTANEMAAHKAACEAFDRGEYDDSKTPRSETVRDDGGKMVGHILRAPWGIGSYTFRDPHAIKLLAAIDAALAGERREGEG